MTLSDKQLAEAEAALERAERWVAKREAPDYEHAPNIATARGDLLNEIDRLRKDRDEANSWRNSCDTCPCCGSPVRVHTSSDGTSSYEPVFVDVLDMVREALLVGKRAAMTGRCKWDIDAAQEKFNEAIAALTPKAEPVCGRASGVRCEVPLCPYPHCDAFLPGYAGPRQDCEDDA